VLAYNPKTGKMEQEPILHVWINHDHDLIDLTITTTTKGSHGHSTKTSEVVHTNQKHPFFTMEHGFLPVGQIKLGMHILRADGSVGVVTGWKVVPGIRTMYNLEVAQDHTFTVGSGQWVVHNQCSDRDRAELRRNVELQGTLQEGQAAHHIVPCELRSDPLVQRAGFDINSAENGIGLPTTEEMSLTDELPQHSGSHPAYTRAVGRMLTSASDNLAEEYGNFANVPQEAAMKALQGIISNIRGAIIDAGGGCSIQDVLS